MVVEGKLQIADRFSFINNRLMRKCVRERRGKKLKIKKSIESFRLRGLSRKRKIYDRKFSLNVNVIE